MASIDLQGVNTPITVVQGNTMTLNCSLFDVDGTTPLNMTGYVIRAQVRTTASATDDRLSSQAIINSTLANSELAWVSQSGGTFKWVLGPSKTTTSGNPKVQFSIDSPTELLCYYDIEVEAPSASPGTFKPWYGTFTIKREVTK
jgi:hypothetical protein